MSVLKCINNESKRFHTFESNRLTVIHNGSSHSEWHYVNRDNNPAVQVQVSSLFKLIYYKFMTSILQSLEYETYDVPLLAVSYSYSRQAVV